MYVPWFSDSNPVKQQGHNGHTIALTKTAFPVHILLYITIIILLYNLTSQILKKISTIKFRKLHECTSPPKLPYKYPLAIDRLLAAIRSSEEKRTLSWFQKIFNEVGETFEQVVLGGRSINTVEPENLHAILSSDFASYNLGTRRAVFAPLLGDGIFTQDGVAWRHSRDVLRPLFCLNRMDVFRQVENHTDKLVDCILPEKFVDLQPLFFRFALDITTFLLFGKSVNSLEETGSVESSESRFSEAFKVCQDYLFRRGRLGGLFWLVGGREFRENCSIVHQFLDDAVREALSAAPIEENMGNSFLDILVRETRDPKVLRDQLLNVLLAGRDTTACCLSWTFRLLAQHPQVLAKLREEISTTIGVGHEAQTPDKNSLKKMKYLHYVLKEVLRLYPPVPMNCRTALKDTILPKGGGPDGTQPIMVRKGENVGYTTYVMHRSKRLYGEDAETFRPERWDIEDRSNVVNLRNIGWGYLPFNGGPRVCLGQEFALLEVGFVVTRILQRFRRLEMENPVRVGLEKQDLTLVLASTDGCRIKGFE
ncbi:hypothetical protein HYFRA_00003871 [Hymenoscyphus fraxineus]|uniref:Cytochrome P450 alkane hydroxylase n=1 Tax=Hymenoscyphus fraxineus TaxID=746836 RepID=A0A9N9KY07_9HELO|nr:hypothetical protein HYFRA_00003871 [Hymenoscyphus fraxineus]